MSAAARLGCLAATLVTIVGCALRIAWDLSRQVTSQRTLTTYELAAERRELVDGIKGEKSMEKYGVSCGCVKGEKPPSSGLEKTASGDEQCRCCGRVYEAPGRSDE